MTEEEILKDAIGLLSDACCLLYELESEQGIAAAYMANAVIKYADAIHSWCRSSKS